MTPPGTRTAPAGALDGYRVLEIGTLIAGPFAGRLLADMGAQVIKIEAPDRPDPLREWGQAEREGHHFFWTVHARNKECVTLDLRSPAGVEIFLDLVAQADIVLESFRPGTLERWNLGYEVLAARNPGIVLARVSGYGQTGPDAARPGYASVAEGLSGMRYLNGYPDQPPPRLSLSLGDSLGGMFATQGILAALLARVRTGRGQQVDVSLTEACLAVTESVIPDYDATGFVRQPSGTRLDGIAPSNIYRSADGTWLIIAANQDTVFARLCAAMDRTDLITDPRFVNHLARGRHQDAIDGIVAEWAGGFRTEELLTRLADAGVVTGPVNTVAEVVRNPQLIARGAFAAHDDEALGTSVLGPGIVPVLSDTPGSVRWAGRRTPGADNHRIYGELLGLPADTIEGHIRSGVM
ncbi:CoA transferase [Nakamurella silvestris]|nr:CoA transferase [Nakamurella silvestris]